MDGRSTYSLLCIGNTFFSLCCSAGYVTKEKQLARFTKALDSQCYNIYLSHCLIILWLNDYLLTEIKMSNVVQRFLDYSPISLSWFIYFLDALVGNKDGSYNYIQVYQNKVSRNKKCGVKTCQLCGDVL